MENQVKNKLLVVTILSTISAIAQGNGTAGITGDTNGHLLFWSCYTTYAIGQWWASLVGGKVYNKFSSGDQILARLQRVGLSLYLFDCSGNCLRSFFFSILHEYV
jgi:hypothetical protein